MDFLRTIDTDPTLVSAADRATQQALDIGHIFANDVSVDHVSEHHAG